MIYPRPETVAAVPTHVTVALHQRPAQLLAAICPKAPPGVQTYADQVLSWVKWGVLAVLGISFFASVGMLVWGRVTHHPRGARLGFDGLLICIVGAIIYVAGYVILTSITGNGC